MNSGIRVVMDTVLPCFRTRRGRNLLGWSLAIVVSTVGAALGSPPEVVPDQPLFADSGPPLLFAAEPNPSPECDRPATSKRGWLARWWHDRFKPHMQFTHWGYPEYFEEKPFGTAVRSHQQMQISKGWAARSVLYQYDFRDGDVMLNPRGERRLRELLTEFPRWAQHPLMIEATPQYPQLASTRRDHVAQLLHDNDIPARVEVGLPTGFMPLGDEARWINNNLREQMQSEPENQDAWLGQSREW